VPSSLGPAEILVILVVALIVLGPSRLPQAGRQVGKALAEVRRWSNSFQNEIRDVLEPDDDPPFASSPSSTTDSTATHSTATDSTPTHSTATRDTTAPSPTAIDAAATAVDATGTPAGPAMFATTIFPVAKGSSTDRITDDANTSVAPAPSANGSSDAPAEPTPDRPAGGPPAP
jgi:sec-independent protein translocase protein TatA